MTRSQKRSQRARVAGSALRQRDEDRMAQGHKRRVRMGKPKHRPVPPLVLQMEQQQLEKQARCRAARERRKAEYDAKTPGAWKGDGVPSRMLVKGK